MSCLLDRSQLVKQGNMSSKIMDIKCGLPQRSILGKLLFLIDTNEIFNVSDLVELIVC